MTVYVDDMYQTERGRFGRMKMSHMMSDSEAELLAMADRIGMARRWLQCAGQGRSRVHFDVSLGMRAKAIDAGAKPVTMRELGMICQRWREADANA